MGGEGPGPRRLAAPQGEEDRQEELTWTGPALWIRPSPILDGALLYPVSRYEFGLLPEPIRITTNKLAERWVISPLLLAGLAYFIYRDAAPALTTAASGGWP